MKTPHTSAPRGKRVALRFRDGRVVVGKFLDRQSKFIILDCGRFRAGDVACMSIVAPKAREFYEA